MPYASKTLISAESRAAASDKRLSICLGADGFSFSVMDGDGTLYAFGEAEGSHATTMTAAIADIKAYFASVGINPLGFGHMELVALSGSHVWVPDELYTAAANRQYLKLVGGERGAVMAAPCASIASTAVFSTDDQLVMAFKVALPGLVVMNQHVRLVQLARRSADHPVLCAHWWGGGMDVAAFRDGRYLYGNTLRPTSDDEARFRLIEALKAFEVEAPTTELLLCGDVDRERYARLRPYFPTVTLYSGNVTRLVHADMKTLHTYRHALILI